MFEGQRDDRDIHGRIPDVDDGVMEEMRSNSDVDIPENRVGMNGRIGRVFKRDFRSV